LAELFTSSSPDVIEISDINYGIMEKTLNFLYTGKLDLVPTDVSGLFDCARKFTIPVLRKALVQPSKVMMNVDNFLNYYFEAMDGNLEILKTEVLNFFEE
jgi:hypothetical protein